MKKSDYIICFLLGFIALISRVPFVEKIQSHWDGPQYSIAVVRYSFENFTPAPPGYPLYIGLGKFFYFFIRDPHKTMLAVSVFASILGGIIFYVIGKSLYHRYAGLAAAIIFLTGSTFYYFSLTAYPYGLLPVTTTILAYIVYLVFIKKKQLGIMFGLIAAICFGIRPQEIIQIGPLILLGFLLLLNREKIKALSIGIIVTLFWFIPVAYNTGLREYFEISYKHGQTAFYFAPLSQHVELMIKGFLLSFGFSSIFLLYYLWELIKKRKKLIKKNQKLLLFYAVWITPGFLYNLLIRTDHAGYQMSYLAGFLLIITYAIWRTTKRNQYLFIITIILIGVFNLYWFFYNRDPKFVKPYRPTSFHYSEIRKNDVILGNKINFIKHKFDPKTTLIITTDVLWRPYTYYLYNYRVIALSGTHHPEPKFQYTIYDGMTWNMKEYQNKKRIINIHEGINTIVFPDSDEKSWIKNNYYKTYKLSGNSYIVSISTSPGEKLKFSYHSIEVLK